MTDPASQRLSRPPSFMGRPLQSPMGPRTRFQRSTTTPPDNVSPRDSLLASPIGEASPMYSMSPVRVDPVTALPTITEQPTTPLLSSSSASSDSPRGPAYKVLPKPAMLVPAPIISFESVTVPFKNLPLKAFLWTLNGQELQELVSRAIRSSARESFVRLLSLENLDHALPAEVERLNALKAVTQSKYRFLVHRRTMLLQALNSSSTTPEKGTPEDGITVVSKLALQLSQTTAECDKLLEVLLQTSDQLAQIAKMTDVHWASTLAIALRKLNKSYARRTSELLSAKEKNAQLEAELEEAWKEAARIAQEMDDFDAIVESEDETEEAVIEKAEKIQVPPSRRASTMDLQSRRNTAQIGILPVLSPLSPMPRMSTIPVTAGLPHMEEPQPMTPPQQDFSETASIWSTRSGKSMKSTRSGKSARSTNTTEITRLSLVSAAKTRSHRVSKSSLRLTKVKPTLHPPMPDLPAELIPSLPPSAQSSSRPLWEGLVVTPLMDQSSVRIRRTSLDDIRPSRPSTSSHAPTITMDDIYLRPQLRKSSNDIQVVRRTPPPLRLEHPSQSIPPIWPVSDTFPKTTAEHNTTIKRPSSSSPTQAYTKFKNLSKRYSLPFPLFRRKSSGSQSVMSSRSLPGGRLNS